MKKFALACALVLAPLTANAGPIGPFSDLLLFGDSLSDPGNAFATFGAAAADPVIYPNGQYTNGDAWTTKLGADLASGTNFAFGGAKAATDADGLPDFAAQRTSYFGSGVPLGPNPLTVVFFGGNDVRSAAPADVGAAITDAVTAIATGVAELAASGLTDFVVFGLPNLGKLPSVINTPLETDFADLSTGFNDALLAAIAPLKSLANVRYFDTFAWFNDVVEQAELDGKVIDQACLDLFPVCNAANADDFVNYDGLHPTDFVHQALADDFKQFVVPLPAGFVLLLSGLGLMAVTSRLRKA
jgi:phospholipase/lecithinase/hemolysin